MTLLSTFQVKSLGLLFATQVVPMTLLANLTSRVMAGMLGNPIRARLPISMLVFPFSLSSHIYARLPLLPA